MGGGQGDNPVNFCSLQKPSNQKDKDSLQEPNNWKDKEWCHSFGKISTHSKFISLKLCIRAKVLQEATHSPNPEVQLRGRRFQGGSMHLKSFWEKLIVANFTGLLEWDSEFTNPRRVDKWESEGPRSWPAGGGLSWPPYKGVVAPVPGGSPHMLLWRFPHEWACGGGAEQRACHFFDKWEQTRLI